MHTNLEGEGAFPGRYRKSACPLGKQVNFDILNIANLHIKMFTMFTHSPNWTIIIHISITPILMYTLLKSFQRIIRLLDYSLSRI